jgi:hypothetical protein
MRLPILAACGTLLLVTPPARAQAAADSAAIRATALDYIEGWFQGNGERMERALHTQLPAAERRSDVTILDIYGNAASLRVNAGPWVDYMHVAKWSGRWVIVNVLWENRPARP